MVPPLGQKTRMEIPVSHLLATGLEQVTYFLQTQVMPLKHGGSVINLGGLEMRYVKDPGTRIPSGQCHCHYCGHARRSDLVPAEREEICLGEARAGVGSHFA